MEGVVEGVAFDRAKSVGDIAKLYFGRHRSMLSCVE